MCSKEYYRESAPYLHPGLLEEVLGAFLYFYKLLTLNGLCLIQTNVFTSYCLTSCYGASGGAVRASRAERTHFVRREKERKREKEARKASVSNFGFWILNLFRVSRACCPKMEW